MIKARLEHIIDELELISDEGNSFLNKTTGQIFHISNKEFELVENGAGFDESIPNWQNENLHIAREIIETDNYIQLPPKAEINEYGLIMKFCLSLSNENLDDEIYSLIKCGNGAYNKIRNIIAKYNYGKEWYKFKREEFRKLAIDWCINHNIKFL